MGEHLKNILHGIGSVMIPVPSSRSYASVSRDGFRQDARRLAQDCRMVASDMRKATREACNGKK